MISRSGAANQPQHGLIFALPSGRDPGEGRPVGPVGPALSQTSFTSLVRIVLGLEGPIAVDAGLGGMLGPTGGHEPSLM